MHISHKAQHALPLPQVMILGCGNTLLGDDGFGPAVIARLEAMGLPRTVQAIDVGTSIRDYLLDALLAPRLRPRLLLVVDAAYQEGIPAGSVRWRRPEELPPAKMHDVSLHQFPSVNLLTGLEAETGTRIELVLAQAATLPETIAPGLTPVMEGAVTKACELILHRLREDPTFFSTGGTAAATEGRP